MSAEDDELAEFDMTEDEFDAIIERGEPVDIVARPEPAAAGLNRYIAVGGGPRRYVASASTARENVAVAEVTVATL